MKTKRFWSKLKRCAYAPQLHPTLSRPSQNLEISSIVLKENLSSTTKNNSWCVFLNVCDKIVVCYFYTTMDHTEKTISSNNFFRLLLLPCATTFLYIHAPSINIQTRWPTHIVSNHIVIPAVVPLSSFGHVLGQRWPATHDKLAVRKYNLRE